MERGVKRKEERKNKRKFRELEKEKLNVSSNILGESIKSQTDVALRIAKRLFLKDFKKKNVVFSPLSLHVALSMVAAGADGSTLNELLSFLRSNSTDNLNSLASELISSVLCDASSAGGPHLRFANGAWVEQSLPIRNSFKQIVTADYKATLDSVDFRKKAHKVPSQVNLWVEKETNGFVRDLLSHGSLNDLTRLIFVTTLYFKGKWKSDKFHASMTKDYDFHLLNDTKVKVPFMVSEENQFISTFDGFKVLGLPYQQGKDKRHFSMYFFLPNAKDGLSSLVEKVTSKSGFLERSIPYQKVPVGDFKIPKFKFSFEFETSKLLKKLGVVLPFSRDNADLTKMVDSLDARGLYISNIFHKSFIEVNEEGTEALNIHFKRVGPVMLGIKRSIDFVADHPFLFVIREDSSGTILFIGQVLNPLTEC